MQAEHKQTPTRSEPQVFGKNYNVGYIGFTWTGGAVSHGIAWFSRWSRLSEIKVSHTFVVTGPDEIVEAHIGSGVVKTGLQKYFDDPKTQVFFRVPKGWTPAIGYAIAEIAKTHVGARYGTPLILAHALANSLLGRPLNRWTNNVPDRSVSWLLDWFGWKICSQVSSSAMAGEAAKGIIPSELVAEALKAAPFRNKGILAQPSRMIDPQELFEDNEIFEPWKREKSAA